MQRLGISTDIRDLTEELQDQWQDATRDGVVCHIEIRRITAYIQRLTPLVAEQDDAVRLATKVLKIGGDSKKPRAAIRDFERVHGPVKIAEYRRMRKRPDHGNDPSAA